MAKSKQTGQARVYQTVEVQDMTAGLDLRSAPTLMKPNRARRLTNWSLEQPGALIVRLGYSRYTNSTVVIG